MPLLSIVIANYNYGRFLEAAIQSVVAQLGVGKDKVSPAEVELIIIDGGSTDNSIEIIQKYAEGLPARVRRDDPSIVHLHLPPTPIAYWVSERDKGQSDAFNKGFAKAKGKYLTWLNADDIMPGGALKQIVRELKTHPKCEWFTGNLFRFVDKPKKAVKRKGEGEQRMLYPVVECAWGPNYLPKWLQSKGQPVAVYGPATIFTKELFDRVGGMKIYQGFMMDTDLWMRFIVAGVKQRRINCFCWAFRMHEESKTAEFGTHRLSAEQRAKFEAERKRAHEETGYRPSKLNHRLIQLWRVLDGSMIRGILLRKNFKNYVV